MKFYVGTLIFMVGITTTTTMVAQLYQSHAPHIFALAHASFAEAKGEGVLGQAVVRSTIFERADSEMFNASTPADAVYQARATGCMYDGTCDKVPDNLNSSIGRSIIWDSTVDYVWWKLGFYQSPTPGCHSYARRTEFEAKPAYFGTFAWRREVGDHVLACGPKLGHVRPKARPQAELLAPKTSPRPVPRPAFKAVPQIGEPERFDTDIEDAVREALGQRT